MAWAWNWPLTTCHKCETEEYVGLAYHPSHLSPYQMPLQCSAPSSHHGLAPLLQADVISRLEEVDNTRKVAEGNLEKLKAEIYALQVGEEPVHSRYSLSNAPCPKPAASSDPQCSMCPHWQLCADHSLYLRVCKSTQVFESSGTSVQQSA